MKTFTRPPRREAGVALVTTMIVVAILAVVAVAFMQSSSTDRIGSRISVDYTQAKLAAQAAAAEAEYLVSRLVTRYPDSVTVWQNIGGANSNEATVLYARAQAGDTTLGARPAQFGTNVTLLGRPLVSLAAQATATNIVMFGLGALSNALPFLNTPTNNTMVNLNATNQWEPGAFVGLRSVSTTTTNTNSPGGTNAAATVEAPVAAAQWVYIGALPGPTNATNPAVARYAYWVEDESFKVHLNLAAPGGRDDGLGLTAREARLKGSLDRSSNSALTKLDVGTLVRDREAMAGGAFPSMLTALVPLSVTNSQTADAFRFLTTTHSAGLDLSRGGFKRFNINSITNGIAGPTDTTNIRTNLNRVIAAITNANAAPLFGQRFYRLGTSTNGVNSINAVTNNHADIYLQKIAANILDYIDADDQPTIVNNDSGFTLRVGRPEFGIEPISGDAGAGTEGTNSVAALGVENTPRLQEYVIHGRLRDLSPVGFSTNSAPANPVANYRITIDHYFEFWNPGTRDVTLSGAFLKVYDQPRYGTNITGVLTNEGRPVELPLPDITFPAGRVTVLTTAPAAEINTNLITAANITNVISVPSPDESHREFTGQTRDTNATGTPYDGNDLNRYFHVTMRARTTGTTDYESGVILGNDSGLLESFGALPIVNQTGPGVSALHFIANTQETFDAMGDNPAASNLRNVRGGSLAGNSSITNDPSWATGDPRSLNEQLDFFVHTPGTAAASQVTRFLHSGLANGSVPANSSVGAPNANYVNAARWVDFSSLLAGSNNAPLFVRNDSMQSVGEVGHITDPARVPGPSAAGALSNVVYSRGGGRTLRVGQPEHQRWYDGNQTNASRTWTSWRLADIFTTTAVSNNATALDAQGNLTNALGVVRGATDASGVVLSIPGLINPNGLLRDNGAAFQAMLHELNFPSPGIDVSPNLAMNPTRVNLVVTNFLSYLTNGNAAGLPGGALNPLWERGEISQLSVLNSTNPPLKMGAMFDRGREELVRRSIEMITTRGSVFTVYAVGQTLQGTNVTGTARLKQTFQIEPQFATADAFDDNFNPTQPVRVNRRFAAPTNYTTRVLQTFYD